MVQLRSRAGRRRRSDTFSMHGGTIMSWGFGWRPYVPVAKRKARAEASALKLAKKEKRELAPIEIAGRKIASSFWGKAWCDHLECYSDFANRLPRGRSYVCNGLVIDLQIHCGKVQAL